ncbi:globin domain-containing protein [Kitasatospora sp. A2-31]|uniref:globin domain-containing protein n=1 Tax=Kitasatospora sp. A2-31 TaxID=2916414 RepID=UPI001EEA02B8|nr:globin domain-containing protein [Kitasatospora sp. A2-31]MCG6494708.1 FAD-binding oxidoreductase [Kitasatospora sp. A2-31]
MSDRTPDARPPAGPVLPPAAGTAAPAAGVADGTVGLPPVPPMPLDPPDLPPVSAPEPPVPATLAVLAAAAQVRPVVPAPPSEPPAVAAPTASPAVAAPTASPAAPVPPAPPVVPAAVPAAPVAPPVPGAPAPSRPEGARPTAGPATGPLFPDAPGLNWAGPGDSWSRAWALQTVGDSRPAPTTAPVATPTSMPAADRRTAAEQPPTARDVELIRASLAVVEPVADRATAHFYALIFLHHPEVRALFPAAMDVQRDRLFRALLMAARSAGDPDGLRAYLGALGRGHRRYGTLTGHYGPVGECLVAALARYSGSRWDGETELAWRRVYGLVSSIMIEAAEEAARTSPPWWQGEVVAHERRTPDVAVLTVRPDQAYPYRAGQYTSLETPWWPRVWRHFSFATAPRPDGLLTFHVKAVQAGWVSNALVHRAAPGDVLRLGPPTGGMTLDHTSGADLLCLGGGTGIAPIRALVEEVAEYGAGGRSVEVFYGARQAAELYELEALAALAARHGWLTVRPVLSGPGASGSGALAGELPEVVGRFGPWAGRDAYLSGPPAMVRRGVGVLLRAGVVPERIRHDLVGDLAAG